MLKHTGCSYISRVSEAYDLHIDPPIDIIVCRYNFYAFIVV
jgi:hypothetical protein